MKCIYADVFGGDHEIRTTGYNNITIAAYAVIIARNRKFITVAYADITLDPNAYIRVIFNVNGIAAVSYTHLLKTG